MAVSLVMVMWLSVGFVFFYVGAVLEDWRIRIALIAGSGLVLVFNTASITAMIRHYAEDKKFIYELDIRHLDAQRAAKARRPVAVAAVAQAGAE